MKFFPRLLLSLAVISVPASWVHGQVPDFPEIRAEDWPWWRGPQRNGVAVSKTSVPLEWGDEKNVLWKVDIPGRGHGSPTIVGNVIYLATCEESSGSQSVLAYDRETGRKLWESVVHAQGAMRKNAKSTGASGTVACDGKKLFINFANDNAVILSALTLDGKIAWQKRLCDYQIHQGYGASPALFGNYVYSVADTKGGGAIAAFQREDGTLVWKRDRPSAPNYPSPIILRIANKDQLILTGCDLFTSLDPLTGSTLWETEGATTECVTSTVTDGIHVYSSGGYPKNHMSAIRADGSKTIAWENKERVYVPSLLFHEGYLYGVLDAGVAMCWRADTGEEKWKGRLGTGYSASPVLIGDRIYAISEKGDTSVFKASPDRLQILSSNRLGDEAFATPTICDGKIYARVSYSNDGKRQERLVCIGSK